MMTQALDGVEMQSIYSIPEDDPAEEIWSPITEFGATNKLPCTIHISVKKPQVLSTLLHPYLNYPLMAHTIWKNTVVKCQTTMKMKDGTYEDTGPTLFIPSMYEGLFEIIAANDHINHYVSIEEIAEVMPSKFFNCTPLVGMSIVEKDGKSKYIQKGVVAASTLTIDSIFTARWKTEAETGFFKKTKINYTLTEKKYLKCLDSHKEVVYIPLSAEGRFYTFYEQGNSGHHVVYRINEFSREFEFPLKVRLIYGTSPVRNVKFTDLLTLYKEEEIEMIIACPIGIDKHYFIDIPIKSDVYFKLQLYENVTESNESSLKSAMAFSRKYVQHYQRRIRQIMEYDEADDKAITDRQQDGNKIQHDLLKDLSINKHNNEDAQLSIFNLPESSVV